MSSQEPKVGCGRDVVLAWLLAASCLQFKAELRTVMRDARAPLLLLGRRVDAGVCTLLPGLLCRSTRTWSSRRRCCRASASWATTPSRLWPSRRGAPSLPALHERPLGCAFDCCSVLSQLGCDIDSHHLCLSNSSACQPFPPCFFGCHRSTPTTGPLATTSPTSSASPPAAAPPTSSRR